VLPRRGAARDPARPATQWIAFAAILLGYWAFMGWGEPFTPDFKPDPEGFISTPPAIATTILGLRAGEWLRRGDLRRIAVVGALSLAIAAAWWEAWPPNKTLWTSTYVLWTGGWAMLALVALDVAIDLRRWPAIGRRFGMNAIAIYALAWLMAVVLDAARWKEPLYDKGFGWIAAFASPEAASLAFAIAFTALWWAVAAALDRRGLHLRI
jgi:predicted acyltransferase